MARPGTKRTEELLWKQSSRSATAVGNSLNFPALIDARRDRAYRSPALVWVHPMRLAILVLAFMALAGVAHAQDDNDSSGDNGAPLADNTASAGAPASDATASDDASSEDVACLPDGVTAAGVPCTAAPVAGASDDDPFANVSWSGTAFDSASSGPFDRMGAGR